MGMPKGRSGNPAGKPKGTLNKTTVEGRQAIAKFVDGNAHRLEKWLDEMAIDDPKGAFDSFMSVVEYHIPKLSRAENKQTHEGEIVVTWKNS